MEQFKIKSEVNGQKCVSDSSFSIASYQDNLQCDQFTPSSIIKDKTKSIKKTSKYYQQQKKKKSKKGKKVVHTFVMCIMNGPMKSDFVIETDILDLTSRKKNMSDKEVEVKAKEMANRHRDMIMNQKYRDLRKNKQADNKSPAASCYPGMNYGNTYNSEYYQYPGYNMNYMMTQMGWQNFYPNISGQTRL